MQPPTGAAAGPGCIAGARLINAHNTEDQRMSAHISRASDFEGMARIGHRTLYRSLAKSPHISVGGLQFRRVSGLAVLFVWSVFFFPCQDSRTLEGSLQGEAERITSVSTSNEGPLPASPTHPLHREIATEKDVREGWRRAGDNQVGRSRRGGETSPDRDIQCSRYGGARVPLRNLGRKEEAKHHPIHDKDRADTVVPLSGIYEDTCTLVVCIDVMYLCNSCTNVTLNTPPLYGSVPYTTPASWRKSRYALRFREACSFGDLTETHW